MGATDPCFRLTEKNNILFPTDRPDFSSRKARNPKDLIGAALHVFYRRPARHSYVIACMSLWS